MRLGLWKGSLVEQQELPFLHFAKDLPREFREVIMQDVAEALNMQASRSRLLLLMV
jgi:hypothetical protein